MQQETKQCQNCHSEFTIEPDDFQFYEKIKVPAPTFCPRCRLQRRLSFFNLTTLYRRKCDLCGEMKISSYPPEAPYRVYCPECWWSDAWDPLSYGKDYDFSRPFFEQFDELLHQAPQIGLSVNYTTLIESPYNNHAGSLKNCYLNFNADFNEDCAYGVYLKKNKSLLDCSFSMMAEQSYDCMNLFKSSRCVGSMGNVTESLDCAFLRDSDNCQNCFASANLKNKKYYIFNEPYSKEEYFNTIKQWDLGSHQTYQELKMRAKEHWAKFPPKPSYDDFTTNYTGSYVFQSKNCKECYDVEGAEDSKYLLMLAMPPIKDVYDVSSWGNGLQLCYEGSAIGDDSSQVKFCSGSGINLLNAEYCRICFGGSNQFGCVGTKRVDYCILNNKYSKEDYEKLHDEIIQHMSDMPYTDKQGRVYKYGEFFPATMSPFAYNETMAFNFFPLYKEEAVSMGYFWRESDSKEHEVTIRVENLPDHIKDSEPSILKEIIGCAKCGKGFRVIQMEFDFLRKMNLPLPRHCPFCRIKEKMDKWVNNLTTVMRRCDNCGTEFQTPHKKEDSPHILCKKCYLAQVL